MKPDRSLLTSVSRRGLLSGAAGTGIGLAGLALTGCGDDDDEDAGPTPVAPGSATAAASPTAAKAEPKRGGTLVVDSGEPAPGALVYAFNPNNYYLRFAIWDSLITTGTDNRPRLMLAETFEMKPDYTGVHIKLRPGLEFHSGRPLTAEDVRLSIEAFRADTATSQLKPPGKVISDIKVVDKLTLDLTFSAARPFMEDYFALLPIIDEATVGQAPQMKVLNGAGPFKFVSYTPNQGYALERHPNYWDEGKPYLDRIEGRIYADEQSRILALQAGELMHTNRGTPALVKRVTGDKNIKVSEGGIIGSHYLGMVVDYPALKDVRVRQALTLAVDRERIAEEWGEGVIPARALPWPEASPAYAPEDEKLVAYDPDRAKSLLKQAGAEGLKIPVDVPQGYEAQSQFVQDDWKVIGVDGQLNIAEYSAYLDRFRTMKLETTFFGGLSFADAMQPGTFFAFNQAVRIPNQSHYQPESYQRLLDDIAAVDPRSGQGQELLRKWNKLYLIDDPWTAPINAISRFSAMRNEVMADADGARETPPMSEIWIDA